MTRAKAIFVAATRQHVGKTTTSLGLIQGLLKRFNKVGFMKPVGQQHINVNGLRVDKDVQLMKEFFKLGDHCRYEDMSPVLIPTGYTKNYIDGKICEQEELRLVHTAFNNISAGSDLVVMEGTGHTGVGSVVNVNNARVAAELKADMILVANGGLGSAFDELELNRIMCKEYGVNLIGVVLNKVKPEKVEMVNDYFGRLLQQRFGGDIPLLGVIPDFDFLGRPALKDLEHLFKQQLYTGQDYRLRHYSHRDTSLVSADLNTFLSHKLQNAPKRPLYITNATRNDVILAFLSYSQRYTTEDHTVTNSFRDAVASMSAERHPFTEEDFLRRDSSSNSSNNGSSTSSSSSSGSSSSNDLSDMQSTQGKESFDDSLRKSEHSFKHRRGGDGEDNNNNSSNNNNNENNSNNNACGPRRRRYHQHGQNRHQQNQQQQHNNFPHKGITFGGALILAGKPPLHVPNESIMKNIMASDVPVMYVPQSTFQVAERIVQFTPKLNIDDPVRVIAAANHYEPHLDIDKMIEMMEH